MVLTALVFNVTAGVQVKSHRPLTDYRPLTPQEEMAAGNSLNMATVQAGAKDEVPTVISEVPEGDLKTYYRTGGYIYNMAGQEMAQPSGMTIQVTTYSDGSSTTVKIMKWINHYRS